MLLLLSWDAHGNWRDRVTVPDITIRIRDLDAEIVLTADDGMPRPCVVNLDSIATVPREVLRSRVTTLGSARMTEVSRALHLALGLPLPCDVS
ncbi:MAG: type II toxin-antitoxin system PemK/MazF family toxin [Candidatus Dormiibacterota bacterium]